MKISDIEIEEYNNRLCPSTTPVRYRFITPWVALNHSTSKKYRHLKNKDRVHYLNQLLGQNIAFISRELGIELEENRFPKKAPCNADVSHPSMSVNLDACIQCTRCVRACREEQVNDVIGFAKRGNESEIVFDLDDPMGESTCVACGECVQACPTGALMPSSVVDENGLGHTDIEKKVESVCPYCGVGCQIEYNIKENKIAYVDGVNGPANKNRLCVKGRFGFDYVNHPERLKKPLIRI